MAADGSIVIDTELDNKQAIKDLNALTKKIDSAAKSIEKMNSERNPLADQAREYGAALDEAKAKLETLKAEQAKNQAALSGSDPAAFMDAYAKKDTLSSQVTAQQAEVDSLQKKWDNVTSKVEAYDQKIKAATADLNANKDAAGELTRKLSATSDGSKKMAEATSKSQSSLGKFGSRLRNVALGVAVFSVARRALQSFMSYMGNALMTNESFAASLASLKGSLASAFQPIFTAIAPALQTLINYLSTAISYVSAFISILFGTTLSQSKKNAEALNNQQQALSGVGGAAEEAAKQMASFDEINQLTSNSGGGGGGGAGGGAGLNFDMTEADLNAEAWAAKVKDKLGPLLDDIADFIVAGLVGLLTAKLTGKGGIGSILAGVTLGIENISAILSGDYGAASWRAIAKSAVSGALIGAGILSMVGGSLVFGGVIGAVAMIGITYITANWEEIKTMATGFWQTFKGILTDSRDDVLNGTETALTGWANLDIFDEDSILWDVQELLLGRDGGSAAFAEIRKILAGEGSMSAEQFTQNFLQEIANMQLGGSLEAVGQELSDFFKNIGLVEEFEKGLDRIKQFFTFARDDIERAWSTVSGWFNSNVVSPVSSFFSGLKDSVSGFFRQLWTDIQGVWSTVSTWFSDKVINPVKAAFGTALDSIKGFFTNLWDGISSGVKAAANGVLSALESMINFLIDGLNGIISALNAVIRAAGSLFGANWSGMGNVSHVSLPRLAQGAVIPANREFLAVLGDQKSGTNIETPLSTMVEAFNQALRQNGGTGQGNVTVILEIDKRQFARAVFEANSSETQRRGVRLAGAY